MRKTKTKNKYQRINSKNQNGYAILFTVVVISLIMTFASGMARSVLKQIVLSSTANDSQIAFYQADTAGECALYIALNPSIILANNIVVPCGISNNANINLSVTETSDPLGGTYYTIKPDTSSSKEPCFLIKIYKNSSGTTIKAYGYNICDETSQRRVERGIQIEF